jgi:peptide-methionine (R)-S-oxide reductase
MDFMRRRLLLAAALAGGSLLGPARAAETPAFEVDHSDAEWLKLLGRTRFEVLRRAATERPFTSPLNDEHRKGVFQCAGCELDLFASETKFDSRTGWPSFWQSLDNAVGTTVDRSFGTVRTAIHCRRCGGHLGHVFDDGPVFVEGAVFDEGRGPKGLRYCINGLALAFVPSCGR